MRIIRNHNEILLKEQFIEQFFFALSKLEQNETIIIGLSGGTSFDMFYDALIENFHRISEGVSRKLLFAFLDERMVPLGHPERNEFQLGKKLFERLLQNQYIRKDQILSVEREQKDIPGVYSKKVPHIHIGLFGVGPDGHIASLFPGHPLLASESNGYLEIMDSPKPPPHRITVSPRMIASIEYNFLAIMKGKEDVLEDFLDPSVGLNECPVKILYDAGRSLVVVSTIDG